jgi:hypothetical protein
LIQNRLLISVSVDHTELEEQIWTVYRIFQIENIRVVNYSRSVYHCTKIQGHYFILQQTSLYTRTISRDDGAKFFLSLLNLLYVRIHSLVQAVYYS